MTVLIACEGVLRNTTGAPIPEGISLYAMLCQGYRVSLCLDGPLREAEHWLRVNGLDRHDHVLDSSVEYAGVDLRDRQMEIERISSRIDMVLDPSPERVASAMRKGIPALLFMHPRYTRPEFRPDLTRKIRPWATIAAEIDAQKEIERDQRLVLE